MPYQDLIDSLRIYYPALLLDSAVSRKTRKIFRDVFGILSVVFFIPIFIGLFFDVTLLASYDHFSQGFFFIFFSLWLDLFLLEMFYNSYYFRDALSTLRESGLKNEIPLSYEVAEVLYYSDSSDLTAGFLRSSSGRRVLSRLGLDSEALRHFSETRKGKVSGNSFVLKSVERVTLPFYANAIFGMDTEFSKFLFALGIQEKEFTGAASWVSRLEEKIKKKERFWGRDSLGRVPGIGKTLAYGQIFTLRKYSEEFEFGIDAEGSDVKKEIEELEGILSRTLEANALIVANTGSGEIDIVFGLVGKIQRGTTLPSLEGKRVFRVDTNAIMNAFDTKASFENEFVKMMNEASRAGNIILLFENLPGFIQGGKAIGSDVSGLLQPYFGSGDIQIVATSDKGPFHENIENNSLLMDAFEIIRLEEKDETSLVQILEDDVIRIEGQTGLFFTYQAIQTIAQSAARFFNEGSAVDKGKDLLLEIPALAKSLKHSVITKNDVLSLVEIKTGVPTEGVVKKDEKEKLLNLETILHGRVIGQDEAIVSISNAMRRARAGLRNPNRPIGSFLFLGPTGVGKTETAKALAEVFFGTSSPMLRLDMSEYSGSDSLQRLIGSFDSGRSGVLSSMLRDQKYGVLLLDEFEKTNSEVMDLFLQILDEGFFSDMTGKKVNAQNIIVIATSNAGSEAIFKFVQEGKNLEGQKKELINDVVASGQFKPELLNRFDGVILFHPLNEEHLRKIAKLMVIKLSSRLKEQGINLEETDDLVHFLAKEGFDPKFGARPMNRVLQESIEKLLAEKLIRGDIQKGATVRLVKSEESLESLEVKVVS